MKEQHFPDKPNEVNKVRSSNLEFYRIVCMLMIVAHHYVVNSGLILADGPITNNPHSPQSLYLLLLGMWGKTGINCFLMITGYFMCKSKITIRKIAKLLMQLYFYKILFSVIFFCSGYESFSFPRLVKLIMPVWGFNSNFVPCFLVFYLLIPFLTVVVQNISKKQHEILLGILIGCFTVLGTIPYFDISFSYVTWFSVLFFIASYIRIYPLSLFQKRSLWGIMTFMSVVISIISVFVMNKILGHHQYFFVEDSNRVLALLVAVCSFLWFKNINMKYHKWINAVGSATFGVLLIHANSDAMRVWLWHDVVDCVGHYSLPLSSLIFYSTGAILAIYVICTIIDLMRQWLLEQPFFIWYDSHLAVKLESKLNSE